MQPYVSLIINALAEGEQQRERNCSTLSASDCVFVKFVGMRSFHSLSLRYIVGHFQRRKTNRICFDWRENDAYNVEIIDYH
jgi:hypothetical protein